MKSPHPAHRTFLKAFLLPLVLAALVAGSPAGYAQTRVTAQSTDQYEQLSPEALDELVAPIALYPDALIALILPASTVPSDVTLASRYLAGGRTDFENQSWDDSVVSLSRYPEVLTWMDDNLPWTTAVGNAFVAQPADVMNSLQRLRAQAATAGNLNDTSEQRVVREVVENTTYIRIIPAQPEVIYVPSYDPEVVYYRQAPDYAGNIISFGAGFALGSWLNYDCDWGRRGIYRGDYNPGWNDRGRYEGGNRNRIENNTEVNVTNITNTSANLWQPNNKSRRQLSRRKDNYNQRVRTANEEVRAARRVANGKPLRGGRKLDALPQPEPLITNGKNARKQAKANREDSLGKGSRNRDGKTPRPNTLAESVPPRSNKAGKQKQSGTVRVPSPAPDENRRMKKNDNPRTKGDSDQRREKALAQGKSETKKERKSAGKSPSQQPSVSPTVPGSTSQQNAKSPRKSKDRTQPTTQNPAKSRPDRKTPTQVTTPRPNQKQSQRKAEKSQSRKADRPSPQSQPQKQSRKADRSERSSQPQKQKSRDRQAENQKQRSAPAAPSQPQKKRENKQEKKQSQAAKPSKAQPSAAPQSKEDQGNKKKKKNK